MIKILLVEDDLGLSNSVFDFLDDFADVMQVFDGEEPCEQRFYPAEQLNQVPGDFKESAFVKKQIGVGNVCERSACAAGGTLLVEKTGGRWDHHGSGSGNGRKIWIF